LGWHHTRHEAPIAWPASCSLALDFSRGSPVYCQAVLSHDQRIGLDGSPAETVDAEAKDLATKQLATLAARKAKKAEPKKPPAKPAKASRPALPPERPKRDQVRAGLLRRA
jgi:sRNA-binding protein